MTESERWHSTVWSREDYETWSKEEQDHDKQVEQELLKYFTSIAENIGKELAK